MRCRARTTTLVPSLSIFLLLLFHVGSEARAESYAFASLRQPVTASQTAWGGLSPCAEGGAELLRSNPAGLARSTGLRFDASHRAWQLGMKQDWIGGSVPIGSWAVAIDGLATHSDALQGYDEAGIETGTFTPVELSVGVGIGRRLTDNLRIGFAAQYLSLEGVGTRLSGHSFNVGVETEILGSRIGLAARNLGPNVSGDSGIFSLPAEASLGIETAPIRPIRLSASLTLDRGEGIDLHGGLRWDLPGGLALLGGLLYRPEGYDRRLSPRSGLAITLPFVSATYAFVPDEDLGATHQLSLSLRPAGRGGRSSETLPRP